MSQTNASIPRTDGYQFLQCSNDFSNLVVESDMTFLSDFCHQTSPTPECDTDSTFYHIRRSVYVNRLKSLGPFVFEVLVLIQGTAGGFQFPTSHCQSAQPLESVCNHDNLTQRGHSLRRRGFSSVCVCVFEVRTTWVLNNY